MATRTRRPPAPTDGSWLSPTASSTPPPAASSTHATHTHASSSRHTTPPNTAAAAAATTAAPQHPIPTMQGAFEESMRETLDDSSSTHSGRSASHASHVSASSPSHAHAHHPAPPLHKTDSVARRRRLLAQRTYERTVAGKWRQRPGERFHPLWKLVAQISFGLHLLAARRARSDAEAVALLQGHVDELDGFCERTAADLDLAQQDIDERVRYLSLPLAHPEVFDAMLGDRGFRGAMIDGMDKVEHVVERTAAALRDARTDVRKGSDGARELARYLRRLERAPDAERRAGPVGDVFAAMTGNTEGWSAAFAELEAQAVRLDRSLRQLAGIVAEIQKRVGVASRRDLPRPHSAGGSKKGAKPGTRQLDGRPLPRELDTTSPRQAPSPRLGKPVGASPRHASAPLPRSPEASKFSHAPSHSQPQPGPQNAETAQAVSESLAAASTLEPGSSVPPLPSSPAKPSAQPAGAASDGAPREMIVCNFVEPPHGDTGGPRSGSGSKAKKSPVQFSEPLSLTLSDPRTTGPTHKLSLSERTRSLTKKLTLFPERSDSKATLPPEHAPPKTAGEPAAHPWSPAAAAENGEPAAKERPRSVGSKMSPYDLEYLLRVTPSDTAGSEHRSPEPPSARSGTSALPVAVRTPDELRIRSMYGELQGLAEDEDEEEEEEERESAEEAQEETRESIVEEQEEKPREAREGPDNTEASEQRDPIRDEVRSEPEPSTGSEMHGPGAADPAIAEVALNLTREATPLPLQGLPDDEPIHDDDGASHHEGTGDSDSDSESEDDDDHETVSIHEGRAATATDLRIARVASVARTDSGRATLRELPPMRQARSSEALLSRKAPEGSDRGAPPKRHSSLYVPSTGFVPSSPRAPAQGQPANEPYAEDAPLAVSKGSIPHGEVTPRDGEAASALSTKEHGVDDAVSPPFSIESAKPAPLRVHRDVMEVEEPSQETPGAERKVEEAPAISEPMQDAPDLKVTVDEVSTRDEPGKEEIQDVPAPGEAREKKPALDEPSQDASKGDTKFAVTQQEEETKPTTDTPTASEAIEPVPKTPPPAASSPRGPSPEKELVPQRSPPSPPLAALTSATVTGPEPDYPFMSFSSASSGASRHSSRVASPPPRSPAPPAPATATSADPTSPQSAARTPSSPHPPSLTIAMPPATASTTAFAAPPSAGGSPPKAAPGSPPKVPTVRPPSSGRASSHGSLPSTARRANAPSPLRLFPPPDERQQQQRQLSLEPNPASPRTLAPPPDLVAPAPAPATDARDHAVDAHAAGGEDRAPARHDPRHHSRDLGGHVPIHAPSPAGAAAAPPKSPWRRMFGHRRGVSGGRSGSGKGSVSSSVGGGGGEEESPPMPMPKVREKKGVAALAKVFGGQKRGSGGSGGSGRAPAPVEKTWYPAPQAGGGGGVGWPEPAPEGEEERERVIYM